MFEPSIECLFKFDDVASNLLMDGAPVADFVPHSQHLFHQFFL